MLVLLLQHWKKKTITQTMVDKEQAAAAVAAMSCPPFNLVRMFRDLDLVVWLV
jgi:hypothetical protein